MLPIGMVDEEEEDLDVKEVVEEEEEESSDDADKLLSADNAEGMRATEGERGRWRPGLKVMEAL